VQDGDISTAIRGVVGTGQFPCNRSGDEINEKGQLPEELPCCFLLQLIAGSVVAPNPAQTMFSHSVA
jgi:hypothetical protein